MNYARYLVSITLAAMIFAVMFLAQQSRYVFLGSLVDPFIDTSPLNELKSETELTFLSPDGEVFGAYKTTKIDASNKRIILDGSFFASGVLMEEKDISQYMNTYQSVGKVSNEVFDPALFGLNTNDISPEDLKLLFDKKELSSGETDSSSEKTEVLEEVSGDIGVFTFEGYTLGVGEIRVGDVLVRYPLSSIFVERNNEQLKTNIHAYGGAVQIVFEGATQPFILPSHHKVTIYDRLLTGRTGQLYYTKLQKDFRMQRFDILGAKEDQEPAVVAMLHAWEFQEEQQKIITDYAQVAHEKLISNNIGFNTSSSWLQLAQSKFAFGYPERKRDMVWFESTIRPLVESIDSISLNGLNASVVQSLSGVQDTVSAPRWANTVKKHPRLASRWNSFEHAHQVASRVSSSAEPISVFYDFWNKTDKIDTFGDLQQLFADSQLYLSMGQKLKSRDFLLRIKDGFDELDITKSHRSDTTSMRRVLIEMIKRSSFLQSRDVFEVYEAFVTKEMLIYEEGDEEIQEIRLEIARDSLYFLNKYLENGTNLDGAQVLMNIYTAMKVDAITGKLQRTIFTEQETEVITFIQLLGTSNITKETIEAVKEIQRTEDEFEKIIKEDLFTLPEIEEEEEIVLPDGYIQDVMGLSDFLGSLDLNLYKFTSVTNEDTEVITFDGVNHKGFTISGNFSVPKQLFETLKAGSIRKINIRKRYFERFLLDLESETDEEKEIEENPTFIWGQGVSQNDRLTLQRKQFIVELMRRTGIETTIKDVVSIAENRTQYRVLRATIEDVQNNIGFTYDVQTKALSEIVFLAGGDQNKLDKTVSIDGAAETIREIITLILNPPEDETE